MTAMRTASSSGPSPGSALTGAFATVPTGSCAGSRPRLTCCSRDDWGQAPRHVPRRQLAFDHAPCAGTKLRGQFAVAEQPIDCLLHSRGVLRGHDQGSLRVAHVVRQRGPFRCHDRTAHRHGVDENGLPGAVGAVVVALVSGGEDHASRPGVELPQLRVGDVEPKLNVAGNLHVCQIPLARDDDRPGVEPVEGTGEGPVIASHVTPHGQHIAVRGGRARTVETLVDAERHHVDPVGVEGVLAQELLALGRSEADHRLRRSKRGAHQPPPRPRCPQVGGAQLDVERHDRRLAAHPGDEWIQPRPERTDDVRVKLPGDRYLADVPQHPVQQPSLAVLHLHAGRLHAGLDPEFGKVIRTQEPSVRRRSRLDVGEQPFARIVVQEDRFHVSNNESGAQSLPGAG